jgi:rhodanese-related sulfurtransferase
MSIFSFLFGSKQSKDSATQRISASEFKEKINQKKVQLIDVRTPSEYKSGHIGKAKNIDFYSGKFNVEFNKLNKNEPIYVYCRSGNRSRQTAKKLEVMGFKEIYDLKGGINSYR